MLISHSRPRNIAWALRNSSGAALPFLTTPDRLTNGRPGSVTRFACPSGTYVQLEATWAEPSAIGLFGLYGTTLPPGTALQIAYRIAGTSTFTATPETGYVIERPMGERVAWIRTQPGINTFDGIRLRIYTSLSGVAPGTVVEIGEVWLGQVTEVDADATWGFDYDDPTTTTETDLMQPYNQRGTVRRIVTFTLSAGEKESAADNPEGFPLVERLIAKTNRGRQCVVVPCYAGEDENMLPATATFGTLTKGGWKHVDGQIYEHSPMVLREAGIPVIVSD